MHNIKQGITGYGVVLQKMTWGLEWFTDCISQHNDVVAKKTNVIMDVLPGVLFARYMRQLFHSA